MFGTNFSCESLAGTIRVGNPVRIVRLVANSDGASNSRVTSYPAD